MELNATNPAEVLEKIKLLLNKEVVDERKENYATHGLDEFINKDEGLIKQGLTDLLKDDYVRGTVEAILEKTKLHPLEARYSIVATRFTVEDLYDSNSHSIYEQTNSLFVILEKAKQERKAVFVPARFIPNFMFCMGDKYSDFIDTRSDYETLQTGLLFTVMGVDFITDLYMEQKFSNKGEGHFIEVRAIPDS